MRKEPFFKGSFVHVYNRGNRKQEIVRDDLDRWRILQAFYYFNNEFSPENPFRTLEGLLKPGFNKNIVWPKNWPQRRPLVKIIAYVIMDNHFHLILEEIKEGGIAKFMHKFGTGITNRFNTRYKETGRLFQGPYKAKRIDNDNYLTYLSVYVQVKNVFELYPGGLKKAIQEFDKAYKFAKNYRCGSLATYSGIEELPIIDKDNILSELLLNQKEFKELAKNCISYLDLDEKTLEFKFE